MPDRIVPLWSRTGAIFCGGRSSRMGTPKTAIRLANGLTMVEHVYQALSYVCSRIIFVGHAQGVPSALLKKGRHIKDGIPGMGPLGALEALLSCGLDDNYIISPCDLFKATPQLYALLVSRDIQTPAVLAFQERAEPLVGRYASNLLPQVRHQMKQGDLSMRAFLAKCDTRFIEVPGRLSGALSNANSFKDLALS